MNGAEVAQGGRRGAAMMRVRRAREKQTSDKVGPADTKATACWEVQQ